MTHEHPRRLKALARHHILDVDRQDGLGSAIASLWRANQGTAIAMSTPATLPPARPAAANDPGTCVCLLDAPTSAASLRVAAQLHSLGWPALFVWNTATALWIGPWQRRGRPSCLYCLDMQARHIPFLFESPPRGAGIHAGMPAAARRVVDALLSLDDAGSPLSNGEMLEFELGPTVPQAPRRHAVLKNPICRLCSPWPSRPVEQAYTHQ